MNVYNAARTVRQRATRLFRQRPTRHTRTLARIVHIQSTRLARHTTHATAALPKARILPRLALLARKTVAKLKAKTSEAVDRQNLAKLTSRHSRIGGLVNKVEKELKPRQRITYARALQANEHLRDTHYIFTHAQPIEYSVLADLTQELVGSEDELLRHPDAHIPEEYTVTEYRTRCNELGIESSGGECVAAKNDHLYKTEVLSADALLTSTLPGESAISVFTAPGKGPKLLDGTLGTIRGVVAQHTKSRRKQFNATVATFRLMRKIGRMKLDGGLIYSIAVPKEKFKELGWLAHSFGESCHCLKISDEAQLEAYQAGKTLPGHTDPTSGNKLDSAQVRLLAQNLTPENGVVVKVATILTKEQQDLIRSHVKQIAHDILG